MSLHFFKCSSVLLLRGKKGYFTNCLLKGTLGIQKWFFYGITAKNPPFGSFILSLVNCHLYVCDFRCQEVRCPVVDTHVRFVLGS